jgi:hypothetical protein
MKKDNLSSQKQEKNQQLNQAVDFLDFFNHRVRGEMKNKKSSPQSLSSSNIVPGR